MNFHKTHPEGTEENGGLAGMTEQTDSFCNPCRDVIIFTLHQILLGWLIQKGWMDGSCFMHTGETKMHEKFWVWNARKMLNEKTEKEENIL
jgi:hypothetical protein